MNWEYITGFFDADGSVTIAKNGKGRHRSPQISFHNNELDILLAIQSFILKELSVKGHISKKKKAKEHHGQQYDLKYVDFPKCILILKKINTLHFKKKKRFNIIEKLYLLTPRNGKYTQNLIDQKNILETEFFT
jgi:intein-encoded DNA endonuclease-like protein